jgi:hypothetical protein
MRNDIGVHRARAVLVEATHWSRGRRELRAFRIPIPVLCSVFVLFRRARRANGSKAVVAEPGQIAGSIR